MRGAGLGASEQSRSPAGWKLNDFQAAAPMMKYLGSRCFQVIPGLPKWLCFKSIAQKKWSKSKWLWLKSVNPTLKKQKKNMDGFRSEKWQWLHLCFITKDTPSLQVPGAAWESAQNLAIVSEWSFLGTAWTSQAKRSNLDLKMGTPWHTPIGSGNCCLDWLVVYPPFSDKLKKKSGVVKASRNSRGQSALGYHELHPFSHRHCGDLPGFRIAAGGLRSRWPVHCPSINSGWWLTYPSEKYIKIWVRQLGRIIPYIVEKHKMFETTNQLGFKRQTLRMKWYISKLGTPTAPIKK